MAKKSTLLLVLFGIACYGFGALSVTADELYGIALQYGPRAVYYFPLIGATGLWESWVLVFSGLGLCFFAALLSMLNPQPSSA
jgi:hypothetical protein